MASVPLKFKKRNLRPAGQVTGNSSFWFYFPPFYFYLSFYGKDWNRSVNIIDVPLYQRTLLSAQSFTGTCSTSSSVCSCMDKCGIWESHSREMLLLEWNLCDFWGKMDHLDGYFCLFLPKLLKFCLKKIQFFMDGHFDHIPGKFWFCFQASRTLLS